MKRKTDYDGKGMCLEVIENGENGENAEIYCIMELKNLKIGKDRAGRLVRNWLKDNASEAYTVEVIEDEEEKDQFIWFSKRFAYSADTSDADFTAQTEEFLDKLDSFCDTLPNKD